MRPRTSAPPAITATRCPGALGNPCGVIGQPALRKQTSRACGIRRGFAGSTHGGCLDGSRPRGCAGGDVRGRLPRVRIRGDEPDEHERGDRSRRRVRPRRTQRRHDLGLVLGDELGLGVEGLLLGDAAAVEGAAVRSGVCRWSSVSEKKHSSDEKADTLGICRCGSSSRSPSAVRRCRILRLSAWSSATAHGQSVDRKGVGRGVCMIRSRSRSRSMGHRRRWRGR